DRSLVSLVTNSIIVVDLALSMLTVLLASLLLSVLVRDRSHSSSFFTIYKVGLIYDILGLLCLHIISAVPTRGGLLNEDFMESQLYLKTFYSVNYFTHTCQGITNLLLSLNRATAVLLPLHHRRIWSAPFTLPFCFVFQFCLGIHFGERSLHLELYLKHYPTGERFPMTADNLGVRAFWLETFIAAFSSCLFTIILYSIVAWKFPLKRVSAPRTKKEVVESKRTLSLLSVAIVVMVSEKDFRIFFPLFFGITDLYSCLPSYLLIIFCKPIRDQVV
ncbi:hypothetical protein PENTCL1PPCAC_15938, partial [Pristionchus entomophagus]